MTALRCVIDMTVRLGGANCKGALSYWGRWGGRGGDSREAGMTVMGALRGGVGVTNGDCAVALFLVRLGRRGRAPRKFERARRSNAA